MSNLGLQVSYRCGCVLEHSDGNFTFRLYSTTPVLSSSPDGDVGFLGVASHWPSPTLRLLDTMSKHRYSEKFSTYFFFSTIFAVSMKCYFMKFDW